MTNQTLNWAIPKFIQIHTITPYSGVLLNRGDDGQPKRLTFGGTQRTRISSQCLKRHWADNDDHNSIYEVPGAEHDVRSRDIISRMVVQELKQAEEYSLEVLQSIEDALNIGLYGENGTEQKGRQALLLGIPEINYLTRRAREVLDEFPDDPDGVKNAVNRIFRTERDNFLAMKEATRYQQGIRAAVFGRLVTSYTEANIDAAIHVAHAFTVHTEETETDHFSAIDDLNNRDNISGAAYMDSQEISSCLLYEYVVVDVPTLVQNLETCRRSQWLDADRTMAGELIHQFIMTMCTVTPGAKLGGTAPYSRAAFVLVEAGREQPRSLAEAFRDPVDSAQTRDAVQALTKQLGEYDRMYGQGTVKTFDFQGSCDVPGATHRNAHEIAVWARDIVKQGWAE